MVYLRLLSCLLVISCNSSKSSVEAQKTSEFECLEPVEVEHLSDIPSSLANIKSIEATEDIFQINFEYSGCIEGSPILIHESFETDHQEALLLKLMVSKAGLCEQLLKGQCCIEAKSVLKIANNRPIYTYKNGELLLLPLK